jgi:hypothetical protein
MKIAARVLAITFLLILATSANSFGYEVLCQSLPIALNVTPSLVAIYGCEIPANAAASGKSLRVTVNFHPASGTAAVDSFLYFNGNDVASQGNTAPIINQEQHWEFTVMNTGGTDFTLSGLSAIPGSIYPFGPGNFTSRPAIPWTSGWALDIEVASRSGTITVDGDSFLVEIMD